MTQTRSVIVERQLPWPPEKVWRALTQPHLIAEWLMRNDFQPVMDHAFQLHGDWGSVNCRVTEIEPPRVLAYTWEAFGLETVVTWTLSPDGAGTHLRLEQAGFLSEPAHDRFFQGAQQGWAGFLAKLEQVLAA